MGINKFLKRFEKLENTPNELSAKKESKSSRRFERLEVGDKRIEIAITDKISDGEKAPAKIRHTIFCPYCGMENEATAENCDFCKHNLLSELAQDYQEKAGALIKCDCGAINQRGRPYCWICGKYIGKDEEPAKKSAENVITFNIDGHEYKSSDENLPFDIRILMERIRKNGYTKKLVDVWLKERENLRNIDKGMEREAGQVILERESRIREIKYVIAGRIIGLVVFIAFIIFQLNTCRRIFLR